MDQGTKEVRDHYAQVASQTASGCAVCGEAEGLYAADIIARLPEKARKASRGCGDPVSVAGLQPGETVLDLGSGGGIDALIASVYVGESGKVYGVDMTDEMIELARANANEAGVANIEFLKGQIEDIPLPDASVDVVISNCVINLSTDKPAVLREAARVLKPGGRFVVSDIVMFKPVIAECDYPLRRITGCLNGWFDEAGYADAFKAAGFARSAIEPKTIYTYEVLEPRCEKRGRMEFFEQIRPYPEMSGATGSAIVRAWKE